MAHAYGKRIKMCGNRPTTATAAVAANSGTFVATGFPIASRDCHLESLIEMHADFIDKTVSDFLVDCLAALTQDRVPWSKVRINVLELHSQLTGEAPDHPALSRLRAFIELHDANQPRARARPGPKTAAIDRHVGERIRIRRLETNVTQRELAEATGISNARLRTIEAGKTRADAADLYALTKALQLQPSYFFEGFSPLGTQ